MKLRRYFWKDVKGNELSFKEFMLRFKQGITDLTPQQKIKSQILGTRLILIGLVLGIIMSIIAWKNLWWVLIILIGALINTGVQYLGLRQQIKIFKDIEKNFINNKEEGGIKNE